MSPERDFSSRPRPRRVRPVDLGLLALGVAALLVAGYAAADAWSGRGRVQARVEETRRETEEAQARARALEGRPEPAEAVAYRALLTLDAPPPAVLADLVTLMPGDVRLDAVTLSYGEPLGVQVDVVAKTASSYDLFLDRLQRSPLFASVLPGEENRDGELRTSIQMTYRPPPRAR
jgi:hypothetical protein